MKKNSKMAFLYLFVSVFLVHIVPIFSKQHVLTCSLANFNPSNKSQPPIVSVTRGKVIFERSDVSIYNVSSTQYVNILVDDTLILFDGSFVQDKKNITVGTSFATKIEGIAFLENKNNTKLLTKCKLDLKKNAKFSDGIPEEFQNSIIELASNCAHSYLCDKIKSLEEDDFIRGKIEKYDFGDNSIMYKLFGEKYPNINLPKKQFKGEIGLQNTLNLLVDFWIASLITRITPDHIGIVTLPNFNETIPAIPYLSNDGYFAVSNGTLGNLRYFKRSQDVIVTNEGLDFSLEGGLQLKDVKIHFDECAYKWGLFSNTGQIDISIDYIKFNIKIAMNFNKAPCETTVPVIHSEIGKVTFKLSNSSVLQSLISGIGNTFFDIYTKNIVSFLETKIYETINESINKFKCENYRP